MSPIESWAPTRPRRGVAAVAVILDAFVQAATPILARWVEAAEGGAPPGAAWLWPRAPAASSLPGSQEKSVYLAPGDRVPDTRPASY